MLASAIPGCATSKRYRDVVEAQTGHPGSYSSAPVQGWVIDASTRSPVQGVVVVANWELTPSQAGQLVVLEAVTDDRGFYAFPAWGPIERPARGYLDPPADPRLTYFKPGYRWENRANEYRGHDKSPVRTSEWDGKTIALEREERPPGERALSIKLLDGTITAIGFDPWQHHRCDWKSIPRMLLAVEGDRRALKQLGVADMNLPTPLALRGTSRDPWYREHCGSVAESVEENR
jgi:hypothetical protein